MAERWIADWTEDLKRWAVEQLKIHDTDTDSGMYLLGVVLGVMAAQDRLPYPLKDNIPPMMKLGYTDTRMLIHSVPRDGDVPEEDYAHLLALPGPTVPPVDGIWASPTTGSEQSVWGQPGRVVSA